MLLFRDLYTQIRKQTYWVNTSKSLIFIAQNAQNTLLLFWPQIPRGSFHPRQSDSTSAAPPADGRSHSENKREQLNPAKLKKATEK